MVKQRITAQIDMRFDVWFDDLTGEWFVVICNLDSPMPLGFARTILSQPFNSAEDAAAALDSFIGKSPRTEEAL
jgi:hypothetical protein